MNEIVDIGPWIESLDEQQFKATMRRIDAEIAALQNQRSWIADALALKARWNETHPSGDDKPSGARPQSSTQPRMLVVPDAHIPLDGPAPRGKTAAVLRVLGSDPNRTWSTQEIRDILVQRGWMKDSDGDYASLMSTLSRMSGTKDEGTAHIYRPSRGHYRLAPPPEEP